MARARNRKKKKPQAIRDNRELATSRDVEIAAWLTMKSGAQTVSRLESIFDRFRPVDQT